MSDADLGRGEAQRYALTGVIARFTADRDNILAAVQSCQERVTELVERLQSDASAESHAEPSPLEALVARCAALEARVDALARELAALRDPAARR